MYKIQYINGDRIETTTSAASVLGTAVHKGLEKYYQCSGEQHEAYKIGLEAGLKYIKDTPEGFIGYTSTISTRTHIEEKYLFAYQEYIGETKQKTRIKELVFAERMLKHKVAVEGKDLPVALKASADLVYYDTKGLMVIEDHKIVGKFSDKDKIDGKKLLQATINYFTVYAETGIAPDRFIFNELKHSKNAKDKVTGKSPSQLNSYTIVYKDHPLMFDFFYRVYEDVNSALLGESVFIPNLETMYDNEVGIIAYTHRLDLENYKEEGLKQYNVNNLTELLKEKIQSTGAMKKYLETVEKSFVSASTLNYKEMNNQDRIKMKLAEHGMAVEFDSEVKGTMATLYRFEPSTGIKMSRLAQYKLDIEQVLGVTGVRILTPIPNTSLVGFEVPNQERTFISNTYNSANLIIGEDIMGTPIELIVEEMPHLLVSGTTGSGKSVFLQQVYSQLRGDYEFVILDPKGVEFPNGISDAKQSALMLSNLVEEMNLRYEWMKENGFKKWSDTGKRSIVVLIDEYNDLFMSKIKYQVELKEVTKVYAKKTIFTKVPVYEPVGQVVEHCVEILAQKARAAGIHIVLATQRPSVKVISGNIKANFPTRISFRLPTVTDSQVILDTDGAETLLGKGDGLVLIDGRITRFQAFSN